MADEKILQRCCLAVLEIIKGQNLGSRFSITTDTVVLGQPNPETTPAIRLDDPCVSHSHASIRRVGEGFVLTDLCSTNGTGVNGYSLRSGGACRLRNNDLIGLAFEGPKRVPRIVLRFTLPEKTVHTSHSPADSFWPEATERISLDIGRRQVIVDNEKVTLNRKEYELLALLYGNKGNACSHEQIADAVWPEREGAGVGNEEIHALVRKLRKILDLAAGCLITVHGYGYMLDV